MLAHLCGRGSPHMEGAEFPRTNCWSLAHGRPGLAGTAGMRADFAPRPPTHCRPRTPFPYLSTIWSPAPSVSVNPISRWACDAVSWVVRRPGSAADVDSSRARSMWARGLHRSHLFPQENLRQPTVRYPGSWAARPRKKTSARAQADVTASRIYGCQTRQDPRASVRNRAQRFLSHPQENPPCLLASRSP